MAGSGTATTALAAGFAIKQQSATAQGNAFAGATAGAESPSYMFFNPAALGRFESTGFDSFRDAWNRYDLLAGSWSSVAVAGPRPGRRRRVARGAVVGGGRGAAAA